MEAPKPPHEALFLVLPYLHLHQLLSMSQVNTSLRDAISSDVLVWLDLVVEKPLNLRLTDDILMGFASKAQGRLRTLALLNCFKITDDGLMRVINANPLLTKLYVPSCTGLTPGIVLEAAKTLTDLKQVKIDGIYNFNQEHLEELLHHLPQTTRRSPRFYHEYRNSTFRNLNKDDSRTDVGLCPNCNEVKMVFDCVKEACRSRKRVVGQCLGCVSCIPRCEGCGICTCNEDYEELAETLCNDTLCLDCWAPLPKCNHCNKSFCPRHADELPTHKDLVNFVCEVCEMKQTKYI